MSAQVADPTLPRGLLIGAGVLVVSSLVMVGVARLTGYGPPKPPPSRVVASYDLRFEDRTDGAVLIYDQTTNQLVDTLQPGTNGFVRGVLRGLVRERRAEQVGPLPPFRLTRWADGRLSLDDPSTGRHIDLEVFGPTNAGAFANILIASGRAQNAASANAASANAASANAASANATSQSAALSSAASPNAAFQSSHSQGAASEAAASQSTASQTAASPSAASQTAQPAADRASAPRG
jgi:putative photosynthetic complex assembly protein